MRKILLLTMACILLAAACGHKGPLRQPTENSEPV